MVSVLLIILLSVGLAKSVYGLIIDIFSIRAERKAKKALMEYLGGSDYDEE